uniref:8 kDa Amblyomma family member n=1 Tax=Rhipicephalus zambeziensis TaxID=60191 RepID=A0A224YFC5_9ACAR
MISSSVRLFLLATAGIILTTQSKGGLAWLRASQPEPKCIEQPCLLTVSPTSFGACPEDCQCVVGVDNHNRNGTCRTSNRK